MGEHDEKIQDPAEPKRVGVNVETAPNEAAGDVDPNVEASSPPAEGVDVEVNVSQPDNASDS